MRTPAVAAALTLLLACGSGAGGRAPDTASADTMTTPSSDSLDARLTAPATVRAGEPVALVLIVRNTGPRPRDLYLRGREPVMEVVVERPDGREIWRRLEGEIIPAIVNLRSLAPGSTLELRAAWDQRTRGGEAVAAGSYRIRAAVLTETGQLTAPHVALDITPR